MQHMVVPGSVFTCSTQGPLFQARPKRFNPSVAFGQEDLKSQIPSNSWFFDKRLDYFTSSMGSYDRQILAAAQSERGLRTTTSLVLALLQENTLMKRALKMAVGILQKQAVPGVFTFPGTNLRLHRTEDNRYRLEFRTSPGTSDKKDWYLNPSHIQMKRICIPMVWDEADEGGKLLLPKNTMDILAGHRLRILPDIDAKTLNQFVDLYLRPCQGDNRVAQAGDIANVGTEYPVDCVSEAEVLMSEFRRFLESYIRERGAGS